MRLIPGLDESWEMSMTCVVFVRGTTLRMLDFDFPKPAVENVGRADVLHAFKFGESQPL